MFGSKEETKVVAATGCSGCAVKSEGNCTSHLAMAASIIVQGFIEAKITFDRSNPDHLTIVSTILAEDIRDDQGGHVAYDVPKEPKLQDWFFGLIAQRVSAGLKANAPSL